MPKMTTDELRELIAYNDSGHCPTCDREQEADSEPSFSWIPCDCCNRPLGGDRYYASGYNRKEGEIQEYEICPDCMYYAEYGRLGDMTMMDMEREN